jgi:hypothetical protein
MSHAHGGWVLYVAIGIIALAIYFTPWLVALFREHRHRLAIFVLNLFLGWTLLGWVGALVWACLTTRSQEEPDSPRIEPSL